MDQLLCTRKRCRPEDESFAVPLPEDTIGLSDEDILAINSLLALQSIGPSVLQCLREENNSWRMPGGQVTSTKPGLGIVTHAINIPAGCTELFRTTPFRLAKMRLCMSTASNFRYIGVNGSKGASDGEKVCTYTIRDKTSCCEQMRHGMHVVLRPLAVGR